MVWYEILIVVCAVAFVAGVTVWQLIKRKRGSGGCCGDCSGCCNCGKKEPRKDDAGERLHDADRERDA